MADFSLAYEAMIQDEGGYKLTNVEGDRGGMTYAGISRTMNPGWAGWLYLDRGDTPPSALVRQFYQEGYWDHIDGDALPQVIASSIFNFAVNTSMPGKPVLAIKLAQLVVGVTPDGVCGPKTIESLNAMDPHQFVLAYTLAKIARYRDIVMKDRNQQKFLLGWINRSLKGISA